MSESLPKLPQKPSVGVKPTKPVLSPSKKPTSSLLDDAKSASKEWKRGRISAKEFRKEFWYFLKMFFLWFINPTWIVFWYFLPGDKNRIFELFIFFSLALWLLIGGVIFFIKIGLGTLIAQCRRINDMGKNGYLVVAGTILLCVVAYLAPVCIAQFIDVAGDNAVSSIPSSFVYFVRAIRIITELWVVSLLFICLFKKGQPHDNKYGPACKD